MEDSVNQLADAGLQSRKGGMMLRNIKNLRGYVIRAIDRRPQQRLRRDGPQAHHQIAGTGQFADQGRGHEVAVDLAGLVGAGSVPGECVHAGDHGEGDEAEDRGEELWVEVTLPKQGGPRPIRLAVKKDGVLAPLELD